MADRTPESSTVRSALALVGAVDDLLRPGRSGSLVEPEVVVGAVDTIVRAARDLRPHQVDDVLSHLVKRAEDGAFDPPAWPDPARAREWIYTTVETHYADEDDGPEEPGDEVGPPAHAPPFDGPNPLVDGHEQRASAAVEELAARVNESDR